MIGMTQVGALAVVKAKEMSLRILREAKLQLRMKVFSMECVVMARKENLIWHYIEDFHLSLDECELDDLGYVEPAFTWSNKRDEDTLVHKRRITEYRPISLCSVMYTIVAKAMTKQLRVVLGKVLVELMYSNLKRRIAR
ncbi:hypothetical protein Ddye_005953 [Dipteronia dyeriana]|uniref:Uncharacterized protein n=1 Tax=Dipteronia dyeriana TaxID=168575 RepID=A0AAD9XHG1_9ROSI|nr:hypothetical protein Ddye_005953 [Dipteronia dyeriana]